MDIEKDVKGKLMVVPEDAYGAIHYFGNDKLEAIGVLRCLWNKEHNHIFSHNLELPEFAQIYRPLKSKSIHDFINNFISQHDKTHENELIKVTIEILNLPKLTNRGR